jgi:CBS domain-containing protein
MHDIAAFLRAHPPFNSLDDETLARVAESAEIEFFAARSPILASAHAVAECGYVVRCGSVEFVVDGRLLDLVGEGEVFGFASIVSGIHSASSRARRRTRWSTAYQRTRCARCWSGQTSCDS